MRRIPNVFAVVTSLVLAGPCAGAEPPPAAIVRELAPLSVRGVNYFPHATPWGGMWTKTPADVWEKDMALAASLGCNTIRTFLQFAPHIERAQLVAPDGNPSAAYHEIIEQLLGAAWRHGIRAILCFEFAPQWLASTNAAAVWQRAMTGIVERHRDDGRVLMWDLMNEPDDDVKWNDATRAYLKAAGPFLRQLDTNHLSTVGIAFRTDRLVVTGLPDVMQYHEYAGREVLLREGPARVLASFGHQRKAGGARPLLIGEFGMCTARDPRFGADAALTAVLAAHPGTEAEQAKLYEVVLTAAREGRAAGALAWCLHDYAIRNPNESHFGLVRADGSLKPAAEVLRTAFTAWGAP